MSTPWTWLRLAVISAALAFPIGGAIGNIAQAPVNVIEHASFGEFVLFLTLGAYSAITSGGYTYGPDWEPISLHSWIIGTGLILFIVGALWFRLIDLKSFWK
jgi:hypothetical protein